MGWTHFFDSEEGGENSNEFHENKYSGRLNWRYGGWNSNVMILHQYCFDTMEL